MGSDFKEDIHIDWCPGCGDYGILNAVQMALAELGRPHHEVAIFSGIGCSGKTSHYVKAYGIHTLHGRVLPFATGAKLANPGLEVIAVGGDGDGYGIGAGHFLNAGRRNTDLPYIVFNNAVYGLTKGQASPTQARGAQTKSLPQENINDGINPLASALGAGYTWVGRGYAFDIKHLKSLIIQAIEHEGAALLDVLQPCPVYNDLQTKEFYAPRVRKLEEDGYNGIVEDPGDAEELQERRLAAIAKAHEWGDTIPIGVFFSARLPTYEERITKRMEAYPDRYPADATWVKDGKSTADITGVLDSLRVA